MQDTIHNTEYRELTNPQTLNEVRDFLDNANPESNWEVERTWSDRTRIEGPEFIGVSTAYGTGDRCIFIESNRDDYSLPLAPNDIHRIWEIPPGSDATMLPDQSGETQHDLISQQSTGDCLRIKCRGDTYHRLYHIERLKTNWEGVSGRLRHGGITYTLRTHPNGYSPTGISHYEDPDTLALTLYSNGGDKPTKLITHVKLPP